MVTGFGLGFTASSHKFAAAAGRTAKTFITVKNPAISTDQNKFGGASAEFITTAFNDGTSDVIRTEANSDFIFTGDLTWECWVYIVDNGTSDTFTFLSNRGSFASHNLYVAARLTDNKWQWGNSTMGANITTETFSFNTWYHVALVRSGTGSGNFALYVNGTQLQTDTDTNTIGSAGSSDYIALGAIYNATTPNFGLNGYIDEVRISPTARYTSGFTPSTTPFTNDEDTVLLMHLDGTDGSTNFVDDVGTGRSQVGVSAVGIAQVDTAQSQFGGASFYADGSGDDNLVITYDQLDTDVFADHTNTDNYTIECWIRSTNVGTTNAIFGARTSTASEGWDLEIRTNNGNGTLRWFNGNSELYYSAGGVVSANTWHHIAAVIEGSDLTVYVDGSSVITQTRTDSNPASQDLFIGKGGFPTLNKFYGNIDEFRISNTARYTSGFTSPASAFTNDANTLLLLHMDGADGSTDFVDDNS